MKVLIVFESMFGNTAALAGDVMAGLADAGAEIALADVDSAPEQVLLGVTCWSSRRPSTH